MICPYCLIEFDEWIRRNHQIDMTEVYIIIGCPKAPIIRSMFILNENKLSDLNKVRMESDDNTRRFK